MLKYLCIAALLVATAIGACTVNPNKLPLIDSEPQLISKVENGERYLISEDGT